MNTNRTPESVNHSTSAEKASPTASIGLREGWVAVIYFCVYLAYLFVSFESELLHWLTMVALPLALVLLLRRGEEWGGPSSWEECSDSSSSDSPGTEMPSGSWSCRERLSFSFP